MQNVSGAGGTTGSTRAMRAEPDGYTILMGQMGTHAASVALYPNLAYRPDVDFEPIGMVTAFPLLIAARKDFPAERPQGVRRLREGERQPSSTRAHAGVGSIFFTTCLLLNSILEVKPTLVPFNGGAPAMNALVGGQVDYMCADIITGGAAARAPARSRSMRSRRRSAIRRCRTCRPTAEAGLPAFQASAWNGLFAPKGTPKPILDRLADALDKALDDETTRKRMLVLGSDIPDKPQRGQQALLRAGQERDRALVADHQGGEREAGLAPGAAAHWPAHSAGSLMSGGPVGVAKLLRFRSIMAACRTGRAIIAAPLDRPRRRARARTSPSSSRPTTDVA